MLATIAWLFLSFCRVNDLDTALPTGDIFSNRMIWFEDNTISAELDAA
jgi:hypothetical protein